MKGLQYLNAVNIVHRDIKPPNIMKVKNIYKIGDFGFIHALNHRNGQIETNLGTRFRPVTHPFLPLFFSQRVRRTRDLSSPNVLIYQNYA